MRTDVIAAGIDLAGITDELEREGVRLFCESYDEVLNCIRGKLGLLQQASA